MNRIPKAFLSAVTILFFLGLFDQQSFAQSTWEGQFMGHFHVKVNLDGCGSGQLEMFDGSTRIQNDGLIKVVIQERQISFHIPAKQTDFEGELFESGKVISGNFTFPDGSIQPLTIQKVLLLEEETQEITKLEAVEDLLQLYTLVKDKHPDPFRYVTPAAFDKIYSETARMEEETLSIPEFYLMAAKLAEAIKCSHTGLRLPPDQLTTIQHEFPIKVVFMDDKLYVAKSDNNQIPAGSMITKINQRQAEDIIENLKLLVPVNGNNQTTKANIINRKFANMLPIIDNSEVYVVEFNYNGRLAELKLPAVPKAVANTNPELIIFEPRSEELAYLKIPTFGIRDMDQYFADLADVFTQLQTMKTKNLVLDLRDNSGGHPIFAAQLLSYLVDQEFTYFKRNPDVPDFEPLYNPMQPKAINYQGRLFVLVNGGCLSTSGHMISLLKQHSRAKFIGEEPGSTYTCNDFSKKIVLTNSKLELNLPTTTFSTAVEGVAKEIPFPLDYKVSETILDKLAGRDAYWEAFQAAIIPQEAY